MRAAFASCVLLAGLAAIGVPARAAVEAAPAAVPPAAPAAASVAPAAPSAAPRGSQATSQPQAILHLLDYVGVDYAGAVRDGKVVSEEEFKEMQEFSGRALSLMKVLPPNPARERLIGEAAAFVKQVRDRAPATAVAQSSAALRATLVQAYGVQVAPRRAPDMARGAALYAEHCAACHGATGLGDGPAGKGLDPVPANFHNAERMDKRSVYGLYNTITLGVPNTAMAAWNQLGEDERWALAFYVSSLGTPAETLRKGESLWKAAGKPDGKTQGAALRHAFADYGSLATQSAEEVRARLGADGAAVQAWLRAHPQEIEAGKPGPIAFARARMAEAVAAYAKGDREAAQQLAVSAYLEGFEISESALDNIDPDLRMDIERGMIAFRGMLKDGGDAGATTEAIRAEAKRLDDLLSVADDKLSGGGLSPSGAFLASLIILLREGLEAILLLAAIVAFVTRTGKREALPWVHAGWVAALALGGLTWLAATYFISISGAHRELTEGVTALVACVMLLYVGYWLHGKSQAQAWSHFLRAQVDSALERRTLRAMAGISFIAVYREIFEVVLFYEALWVQAGEPGHGAVLGGIATAIVLLALAGWAIFRYSVRLPIGPFFTAMSLLMAVMAVAFAGQGVKALQEAGLVASQAVPFFTVSLLGIYPTLQTLGVQLLTLVLVALGYFAMHRTPPREVAGS
ncbi:MAG TPA: cytochrome c/FTR1 family iron permease [Burkholderiales bacterium]|nr:cytochrome c/FTR1 family iron permease [Burkholderiales bacterium]